MKIEGKVKTKKRMNYTQYLFGDISEIEGKDLKLVKKNENGNCTCVIKDKGLVHVDRRDVEMVTESINTN